jgi:hypothetical protein
MSRAKFYRSSAKTWLTESTGGRGSPMSGSWNGTKHTSASENAARNSIAHSIRMMRNGIVDTQAEGSIASYIHTIIMRENVVTRKSGISRNGLQNMEYIE